MKRKAAKFGYACYPKQNTVGLLFDSDEWTGGIRDWRLKMVLNFANTGFIPNLSWQIDVKKGKPKKGLIRYKLLRFVSLWLFNRCLNKSPAPRTRIVVGHSLLRERSTPQCSKRRKTQSSGLLFPLLALLVHPIHIRLSISPPFSFFVYFLFNRSLQVFSLLDQLVKSGIVLSRYAYGFARTFFTHRFRLTKAVRSVK